MNRRLLCGFLLVLLCMACGVASANAATMKPVKIDAPKDVVTVMRERTPARVLIGEDARSLYFETVMAAVMRPRSFQTEDETPATSWALPVAENAVYTTTLGVDAPVDAPLDLDITNCGVGPAPEGDLPAHGAMTLRKWGEWVCGKTNGFGAFVWSGADNAGLRARLDFNDTASRSSFVIKKLKRFATQAGDSAGARGIVNDGVDNTYLILLAIPSPFTVFVFDGTNELVAAEIIDASQFLFPSDGLSLLHYQLQTQVPAGRIEVVEGLVSIGPNGNVDAYGCVVVGPNTGTAQDFTPLE